MTGSIVFSPLLPWPALAVAAALALVAVGLALWRGLHGWALRGLAAAALIAALAQPGWQREEARPLSDIVLMVVDQTASQSLPGRADQTRAAVARIESEIAALPNTELRRIDLRDAPDDGGTRAGAALATALAEEPPGRVAGAIIVSDGIIHDAGLIPALPAPLHLLLTGRAQDWDRRLTIKTAPAFGIIGEELKILLRVDDLGAVPPALSGTEAQVTISVDGAPPATYAVPVNTDLELPLTLTHGGQNVVTFALTPTEGELTDRNNGAIVQMNGVRDRLRVLLVSGEPHAGERTWRNLLKSDAAVDLVHFTILRPPEKQDGVPVSELSLIAFPTQELFVQKINEFDLIIFDRYSQRGILPPEYFDSIRAYIEQGGAVLVAAGPEFATTESLSYTSLGAVIPADPTGLVLEEGYLPTVTDLGRRHPVTQGLEEFARAGRPEGDKAPWGRWLRQVELENPRGEVVMAGAGGRPLLILDREGEGRVALLASDHAWLWDRGFEGGGPQLELLRRLAHWMMKEPELEEEALLAEPLPGAISVTRRTMSDGARSLTVTAPDGTTATVALTETAPGRHTARIPAPQEGLYRLKDGDLERVVALGPTSPREFAETIASDAPLAAAIATTRGGTPRLEEGLPDIRTVSAGRPAAGRGWIGLTPRGARAVTGLTRGDLLPPWVWLCLAAGLSLAAWIVESRRRR